VNAHPRIAIRLALFHGALIAVCVVLAVALLTGQDWAERQRRSLLDDALPRFADMLEIVRLGDALAETAGALAATTDPQERAAAQQAVADARIALQDRIDALGANALEDATRARLTQAQADMLESLDTLNALVGRRLVLGNVGGQLNARLSLLGDLLPDLERGLLAGKAPDGLDSVVSPEDLDFPPGPSGTAAANAIRAWARNAQVAVGMMLAASGAADTRDLDYLAVRAEEALRRASGAIREADRAARPLMEAVQAVMASIAAGRDGNDSVFRVRRQTLTLNENTPAVLARCRQASDRLTAAVSQIIADLEQTRVVNADMIDRFAFAWRLGVGLVAGLGVVLTAMSAWFLWAAVVARARRLGRAALLTRESDEPLQLRDQDLWPDELGMVAHGLEALDAERRRLEQARREQGSRLTAVFAGLPDAILVLTADRRVEDANPGAARLFGRPVTHLLGRPLPDLVPNTAAEALETAVARALREPGTVRDPVLVAMPSPKGGNRPETRLSVAVTVTATGGAAEARTDATVAAQTSGPLVVLSLRDQSRARRIDDVRAPRGGADDPASRAVGAPSLQGDPPDDP
jgi:PAS domain S-box-containing protein